MVTKVKASENKRTKEQCRERRLWMKRLKEEKKNKKKIKTWVEEEMKRTSERVTRGCSEGERGSWQAKREASRAG